MKRIASMIVLAAIVAVSVSAQNTFFPTKAGTVSTYALKNGKGKIENYSRQTIKDVEGSAGNLTISYATQLLDKDMKPVGNEVPFKVIVKDDAVILDMNQMFAGMQKDQQFKAEITGVPQELPGNMQPGQSLKNADMTMTLDMGIMKMKTVMKMTDGKCLAIEDVTVPAGTFKCHKVTQTVTTTVMKKDVVSKTVSWYAPGIGTVKNETYNDKDKLQSGMELYSLNR